MSLAVAPKPDLPEKYRQAPFDVEAEQALLGAILVNNDAFERVSGFLEAEHFHEPMHQRIFEALGRVIRKGQLASPVTLRPYFSLDASMKEVGGADYLAELSRFSPSVINASDFGRMIFELAQRRDLIRVGEEIVNLAYDPPVDLSPAEQVEEAEKQLYGIAEKGRFGGGFKSFGQAIVGAMEVAERAYMSPSHVTGVGSGFVDIDSLLGGFQKSDLIILAARPAMGKTSLATNMAFHAAREWMRSDGQGGGRVAFFSLEMSAEQLATRILAEQAEVSGSKIRRGKIEERDMQALIRVGAELERLPLFIDDTGGISIAQVAARARRLKRAGDLGLIIVDYLQLLTGTQSKRNENRVQEITEITKGLKTLAKELAVPVIALSQLSRGVDSRDDKRPVLADLRESGSIEQDADVVMFIYREAYYLETKEPPVDDPVEFQKWKEKMDRVHGLADVLVEKHRHGPTAKVTLRFEKQFTRFYDLAKEDTLPTQTR
ncbi:MAG: replicative DNA helicase [Micropepsaceae bacterium]